jgi:CPA2 family monovalent cation:H+ antiporter-2
LERARFVAFTFSDAPVVASALPIIRQRCPHIIILARARFAADVVRLRSLGANIVIHDEREAAHAVVEHALAVYDIRPDRGVDE